MAEVRCPMCGKPNPAELDHCQFCQARLRPVWETGTPKDNTASPSTGSETDPADWLRALGGDMESPAPGKEEQQDWLGGQRSDPAGSDQGDTDFRPADDIPGDSPDWLSRIGLLGDTTPTSSDSFPEQPEPQASIKNDETAWADFAKDTGLPEPEWLKPAPQSDEWQIPQNDDLPDWLKPTGAAQEPAPGSKSQATQGDDLPGWLVNPASNDAAPEAEIPAARDDNLPDWLASTRWEEAAEEEVVQARDDSLPDWLFTSEAEEAPGEAESFEAPSEDLPDWLFRAEGEQPPQDVSPVQPIAPASEADDVWSFTYENTDSIGAVVEREAQEPDAQGEWAGPLSEDDTTEWLRAAMLAGADGAGDAEEPGAATDGQVRRLDTVDEAAATAEQPVESGDSSAASEPEEEEDFAAWMASVGAAAVISGRQDEPESADSLDWMADSGSAPDWLQNVAGEKTAAVDPEVERPGWLPTGDEPGADTFASQPDNAEWLASIGEQADHITAAPETHQDAVNDSDMSWLNTLESSYPDMTLEPDTSAGSFSTLANDSSLDGTGLPLGDLPAWLSGVTETAQPADQPPQADLNPGDLPVWLLGMRPEGVLRSEETPESAPSLYEQVEGAGPLAGLRGALPAEPDIAQAEKPPTYSVMLQVTDAQNTQAKLLADLVAAEAEAGATGPVQGSRPRPVFRWVAALLLIVVLVVSLLTGQPAMYRPAMPAELAAVRQLVEGLQSGAPVLVALDYEPGFSGEMDTATQAVLTHVLRRGAIPTFISTIPTGPMQAERVIGQVAAREKRTLSAGEQYVNQAYLSGGALAMASYASGAGANDLQALQDAGDLARYQLFIVAAADPDRARAWIEQTGPALGSTPLVMILSAQAEPMVRPYYDTSPRQVQGLLSGLTGAVIYETNTAQQGSALQAWSPFNVGLAIALTLMVTGGLYTFLSGRLARRKAASEAKSA